MQLNYHLKIIPLLLLLLSACDYPQKPLRVGTDIWIGYEPLYLAENLGHYDDSSIRLVTMHNANEVSRALRSGMLEVAGLTLDEALSIKQDNLDLKVILVMDISNGADALLANPTIKSLTDLRGKRVGVDSGVVGAVMLHSVLESAQLHIDDITPIHLTVDKHQQAYEEGIVDAVVTFEPVRTQLMAIDAKILFDSSQIPGRIVDVLVTTPEIVLNRSDDLKKLIKGHFAAIKFLKSNPLDAVNIMVGRQGITAKEIVKSYEGIQIPDLVKNHKLLNPRNPELMEPAKKLSKLMLKERLLIRPVSVDGMFESKLLPSDEK